MSIGIATNDLASLDARKQTARQLWSVSKARLLIIFLTTVYLGVFAWIYIAHVSDLFGELGFGFQSDWPTYDILIVVLLAMAPALWIPTNFERPSAFFIYIQYFLIYIPALWMTRHSVLPILESADQVLLSVTLAMSMVILLWLHHRMPLLNLTSTRLSGRTFWTGIFCIIGFLLGALAIELGRNFHLVGLEDIYSLRTNASDLLDSSGSVVAKYGFTWLNAFLLPLMFARAISKSNYFLVLGVFACYLFLYGIWGSKASLFSPLILLATSLWASQSTLRIPRLMIGGLILALVGPVLVPTDDGIVRLVKLSWLSIVDMRTFAMPGLLVTQYFDFFGSHPLTLGSHITGVNLLIHYPYDYDIPRTVGYYYNGVLVTSNANFWAQDGLAAFGLIGIAAVTFFAAGVLWLLDSATLGLDRRFVLTSSVGIILVFANVSIFTTLVTGGLALFILACIAMPRSANFR